MGDGHFQPERNTALAVGTARLGGADRCRASPTTDARRRDQARLAALPDRLLADIGLTRDAVRARRPDIG